MDICATPLIPIHDGILNTFGLAFQLVHEDTFEVIRPPQSHVTRNAPGGHWPKEPKSIICAVDTVLLLKDKNEVQSFIEACSSALSDGGRLQLKFTDLSMEEPDHNKLFRISASGEKRITIVCETYFVEYVNQTELYCQKIGNHWTQTITTTRKLRLSEGFFIDAMVRANFGIYSISKKNGVTSIGAKKRT